MKVPAPFPFKGRSDGAAKARQEPLTTRDCLNVRGYLDSTGRYQGGQRPGLSPELGGGNQPVKDLTTLLAAMEKVEGHLVIVGDGSQRGRSPRAPRAPRRSRA